MRNKLWRLLVKNPEGKKKQFLYLQGLVRWESPYMIVKQPLCFRGDKPNWQVQILFLRSGSVSIVLLQSQWCAYLSSCWKNNSKRLVVLSISCQDYDPCPNIYTNFLMSITLPSALTGRKICSDKKLMNYKKGWHVFTQMYEVFLLLLLVYFLD